MIRTIWTAGSLRIWVTIGMVLAIAPLALSSIAGFVVLDRGVIAAFQDVAARQRDQLEPIQSLRILLWESAVPLNLFLDSGDSEEVNSFRDKRKHIDFRFSQLLGALQAEPAIRELTKLANDDWNEANHMATELFSSTISPGGSYRVELAERFDGEIAATVDGLSVVYDHLALALRSDHDAALIAYERSKWIAGIAAATSTLLVMIGISIIGHFMLINIDRLVEGATRFAGGDRDYRINIRVPPELRKVATEFNLMIERIRDSEIALADLAHRDGMTGLLNRRAFDDALLEAFARMRRLGEEVVLLIIDVDHFKRINDTHGHSAGDSVLRAVAQIVMASVREVDKAFRIGGEEFAVLLQGTDAVSALVTAERLRAAISEIEITVGNSVVSVTASIGAATSRKVKQADALFKSTDAALYRAKEAGRNRVVAYSDD